MAYDDFNLKLIQELFDLNPNKKIFKIKLMIDKIRIGTRGGGLALWQANFVKDFLENNGQFGGSSQI